MLFLENFFLLIPELDNFVFLKNFAIQNASNSFLSDTLPLFDFGVLQKLSLQVLGTFLALDNA